MPSYRSDTFDAGNSLTRFNEVTSIVSCEVCKGHKKVECPLCEGLRCSYDEYGDLIGPCEQCHGENAIPCAECNAEGEYEVVMYV